MSLESSTDLKLNTATVTISNTTTPTPPNINHLGLNPPPCLGDIGGGGGACAGGAAGVATGSLGGGGAGDGRCGVASVFNDLCNAFAIASALLSLLSGSFSSAILTTASTAFGILSSSAKAGTGTF